MNLNVVVLYKSDQTMGIEDRHRINSEIRTASVRGTACLRTFERGRLYPFLHDEQAVLSRYLTPCCSEPIISPARPLLLFRRIVTLSRIFYHHY